MSSLPSKVAKGEAASYQFHIFVVIYVNIDIHFELCLQKLHQQDLHLAAGKK